MTVVQKLSAAEFGSDCSSLSQDHNDLLMRNANDTEVAAAVVIVAEAEIRRCKAEAGTADSRHRKAEAAMKLRQA